MKKNLNILTLMLLIFSKAFSQLPNNLNKRPSIITLKGTWECVKEYPNGYSKFYWVFMRNKAIEIIYTNINKKEDVEIMGEPEILIGFSDKVFTPNKINELDLEGSILYQFVIEGIDYDKNGNLHNAISVPITVNGEDYYNGKDCFRITTLNGDEFIYNKIEKIPLEVENILSKNKEAWNKYNNFNHINEFQSKKNKIVKSEKTFIYNSMNNKEKSPKYLIKGDQVEILEETGEWLKIRYKGKKITEGWIKKSDVE